MADLSDLDYRALHEIYLKIVAGQSVRRVSSGDKAVEYGPADIPRFEAALRNLQGSTTTCFIRPVTEKGL